jgi:N-acetylglutamate synthase-like GNAT family acetyltransferase
MDSTVLRVRRATTDDRESLKALWEAMLLPANDLEKRLTEFQVVESADGKFLGAIGIQIVRQHAWLHSEGYLDFAHADQARQLFWERAQTLASNHGVFRMWTQESSPFWAQLGFRPASAGKLSDLPPEWQPAGGEWFVLQLKDEEAIAKALDKDFAAFMSAEKRNTERTYEQARTLKNIITIIGFAIGILCFGFAAYLLVHRNSLSPGP